jgi:TRAP-type uncharacterized transport system substrate-binding protein
MFSRLQRHFFRTGIGVAVLIAIILVLLWAVFKALKPLPGRNLTLATGPPGSTYASVGERYREILARTGVRLKLVSTNGAVDNARLLRDPSAGVSAGFVQAGTIKEEDSPHLASLGAVFYEAVWLFCRCNKPPSPSDLVRWRLSIGPIGSADRPLALKLLGLNGFELRELQLYAYSPEQAAVALRAGQLDGVVLLTGWDSKVVQDLARAPEITLLGFPRANAYVALNPQLNKLVLPQGVADLAANRPPADVTLIASKASLAVRDDLHPALQYLLMQAALEVHSRPGMFNHAGEFPAPEEIDLPLSPQARALYKSGPTFLQRSLPFWLAELVQRLLVLIVPIVGIIYPLWSLAPRLYNWQMQRRLSKMYRELRRIENQLHAASPERVEALITQLEELDRRALSLNVPSTFSDRAYGLHAHIHAARERAPVRR